MSFGFHGKGSSTNQVVTTSLVKPDKIEGLRKTMNVILSRKTSIDKNCLNAALFFGDLNSRNTYWGDKTCNLLDDELLQTTDHFSILNEDA